MYFKFSSVGLSVLSLLCVCVSAGLKDISGPDTATPPLSSLRSRSIECEGRAKALIGHFLRMRVVYRGIILEQIHSITETACTSFAVGTVNRNK